MTGPAITKLTQTRNDIREALKVAGMTAHVAVPERFSAPAAFVGPGDPYVTTENANLQCEIVRCDVTVVASPGVNETTAAELDQLILTAFDALQACSWLAVENVSSPGQITLAGQKYVAAVISCWTEIHRERTTS